MKKSPKRFLLAVCFSFLAFAACFTLSPGLHAQTEPSNPVGGLEFQDKAYQKFKPEVEAVLRGYYAAVEAGDFEKALTYYAWRPVSNMSLVGSHENVLQAARIVKQQLDHNGGLRRAGVYGIFKRGRELVAIVELEFNNGRWDISPGVLFGYDGDWGKSELKLFVAQWGSSVPPPVVGLGEMYANYLTIYRAGLAGDIKQMRALSYMEGLYDYYSHLTPAEIEQKINKEFERIAEGMQQLPRLSGGVASIDIPRMNESGVHVDIPPEQNNRPKREPLAVGSVVIRRTYPNGRSDTGRVYFILDRDGRWKANPNRLN